MLLAALLSALAAAGRAGSAEPEAAALFERHCAVCHGREGRGDGTAASQFETRPADLTDGLVKLRSTPQEAAPLLTDLARTIREGSRGTAMVEWSSFLDASEIQKLAQYVLALEGYDERGQAAAGNVSFPSSAASGNVRDDGAALYRRFGCAQCHGDDRRGAGPAAAGLVDLKGRPVRMPDLTALPFKRGSDPVETAKTLLYGMDGTPMASFEGAMTADQALAIARWLIGAARVERRGFVGEEHLGFMIEMHEGGRHGMGAHRGMRGRHAMRGRSGVVEP
jgi:mono/diheme cytochrome c family protein